MDRVRTLAPALAASWMLLAQQGARIGPYVLPALSWRIVLLVVAIAFFTAPAAPQPSPNRVRSFRFLVLGALAVFALAGSTLWRNASLYAPLSLMVRVGDGSDVEARSLQLERRRDLRRLTGKRRNVTLETRAVIEVPRDGTYRFEVECDDACTLTVAGERRRSETTATLARGAYPFALRYRQAGGPASLTFGWDGPAVIELLPIEYYLSAPGEGPRDSERLRINTLLAVSILSWLAFSWWLSHAAPRRHELFSGAWAPATAAALVILYGSLLRVEAFLVHSGLAENSPRGRAHYEALRPFVPPYTTFNPATRPEDPYRADVRSYLDRAESFRWSRFYAPSFREPFTIALTKPFLTLADGEIGILFQSLFFSAATLVLFFFVARALHGPWWSAVLLVPLALHEWLVREAPSGYRMSAYAFWLLAAVFVTFHTPSSRLGAAASGVLHGLLSLIRLSALSVVAPILGLRARRAPKGRRLPYTAAFLVAFTLLVGPFLLSNTRAHGDPFYSISFHTEFWLRAEGLEQEAERGPVPWAQYFTAFGRTRALVEGTLLGMTVLPVKTFWRGLGHFPALSLLALVLGTSGLILSIRSPHRFLATAYFGHLIPFAYIQNFPSGQMPRFVMPAYFFLVLAVPIAWRSVLTLVRPIANVETSCGSSPSSSP